jgi:hypothetical protein
MTAEQLSQQELRDQTFRTELIKGKIMFTEDEMEEMTKEERIVAIMRMKQDETMKWQRLASQLHYYIMVGSLILGGLIAFAFIVNHN